MAKAKKTSKGKVAAEIGAGLIAAAAAGYYFYGSKRAKKHRDVVEKELKSDWKLIRREAERAARVGGAEILRAKVVGKKVLATSKKVVKRAVKKSISKKRKSR